MTNCTLNNEVQKTLGEIKYIIWTEFTSNLSLGGGGNKVLRMAAEFRSKVNDKFGRKF